MGAFLQAMMQRMLPSKSDKETQQFEVDNPHITCGFCSTISVIDEIPSHEEGNQHAHHVDRCVD